jgi:hypothetical protein
MSRIALASTVMLLGCAHGASTRAPEALTQIQWSGPPPHVGVQLAGAGANAELQAQCDAAVTHSGVIADGNAPVQAIVTLDGAGARLDLLSQQRGIVRSEKCAPLPVEHLCARAAVAAASIARDQIAGSPMDSQGDTYAIMPVRSQDLHSPTSRTTTGPELGPGPPNFTGPPLPGASSNGPIQ